MSKELQARGYITMVSKVMTSVKPDYASIGGFSVNTPKGEYIFDWVSSTGNAILLPDGRMSIEWQLREVDWEFCRDSNEGMEFPGWDVIAKSPLTELYYEVSIDGESDSDYPDFEPFSFEISTDDKDYQLSKTHLENLEHGN